MKYLLLAVFLLQLPSIKCQNLETRYKKEDLNKLLNGRVIIYHKINNAIFTEAMDGRLHFYTDSLCTNVIKEKIELDHRYIVDISICWNGNIQIKYPRNTRKLIRQEIREEIQVYYSIPDPKLGDDTTFYISQKEVLKSKNQILNFWIVQLLLDYGVKQNNINKLQDIIYLSLNNIYKNCLINSLQRNINGKTLEFIPLIPFSGAKCIFHEIKLDTNTIHVSKYNSKNMINNFVSLSIISSYNEDNNESIKIKSGLIGFSYLDKGVINNSIEIPTQTIYWNKRDLKKILTVTEYAILFEYVRLALFMQITSQPCW